MIEVQIDGEVHVASEGETYFTMRGATVGVEDTCVLVGADLVLARGHRYGIVGENGAGKTTLMRAILERIEDSECGLRVEYVGQNDAERSEQCAQTAEQYCAAGDRELVRLQRRLSELESAPMTGHSADEAQLAEEMERIMLELEVRGADTVQSRAEALLQRLGFPVALRRRAVSQLSGGWRTRLELARALFAQPDVLMLDEPTNHLDLAVVLQLATLLRESAATMSVLVVSHDASFLDLVCTDILSVHAQSLQSVAGNYAHFEARAEEYRLFHERLYEKRQKEEERQRSSVQHQKAAAGRAGNDKGLKQAASRARKADQRVGLYREDGRRYRLGSLKKLAIEYVRMPARAEPVRVNKQLTFRLPEWDVARQASRSQPLVSLDNVTLQYDGMPEPLMAHITASVYAGDRIALVGRNGTGKTTLVRALTEGADFSAVRGGRIERRGRVAVLGQNQLATLEEHLEESSVAYLLARHLADGLKDEAAARAHLARFGLGGGDVALLPVQSLSGGLRVRLLLADAFAHNPLPDLLVLDEPTNHLDFESITALGNALRDYPGAVLAVSHNCAFILEVCSTLWVARPLDPKRPLSKAKRLDTLVSAGDRAVFADQFRAFARELVPSEHAAALDDMLSIRATRYSHVTQRQHFMTSLLTG